MYDSALLMLRTNVLDWASLSTEQLVDKACERFKTARGNIFRSFLSEWNRVLQVSYQEGKARIVERAKKHNESLGIPIEVKRVAKEAGRFDQEGVFWLLASDDDDYFHPDLWKTLLELEEAGRLKSSQVFWHQWATGDEHDPFKIGFPGLIQYAHSNNVLEIRGDSTKNDSEQQRISRKPSPADSLSYAMKSPWSFSYYNTSLPRFAFPNAHKSSYWQALTWAQKVVRLHQLFIRNTDEKWDSIPDTTWWKPHWRFTYDLCKEALGDLADVKVTPEVEF